MTRPQYGIGTSSSSSLRGRSQSGASFAKRWSGVPVSELYMVMSEQMPKDLLLRGRAAKGKHLP